MKSSWKNPFLFAVFALVLGAAAVLAAELVLAPKTAIFDRLEKAVRTQNAALLASCLPPDTDSDSVSAALSELNGYAGADIELMATPVPMTQQEKNDFLSSGTSLSYEDVERYALFAVNSGAADGLTADSPVSVTGAYLVKIGGQWYFVMG